jgi:hypothetical protein
MSGVMRRHSGRRIGIFLRLDETVGLGHWGRCLPLAAALQRLNAEIVFFVPTASDFLSYMIAAGFDPIIEPVWNETELTRITGQYRLDAAVLDFHQISRGQVTLLHRLGLSVLALSVIGDGVGLADLLANPAASTPVDGGRAIVMRGCASAIVDEVALCRLNPCPEAGALTVAMGGSALARERIPQLVRCLLPCQGVQRLDLFANPASSLGCEAGEQNGKMHLHPIGRDSFLDRLARSRLLVCGYGTSLFEAARLGVPAIVLPLCEQQLRYANQLHGSGFFRLINPGIDFAFRLGSTARQLLLDEAMWLDLSACCRKAVDGKAADRIASRFLTILDVGGKPVPIMYSE